MPGLVQALKERLRRTPVYDVVQAWRQARLYRSWLRAGRPVPPPHRVKQRVIREFAARTGIQTLVETGTYRGDMVQAMSRTFRCLYSIELSRELYEAAVRRFAGRRNITILQGDSGQVLARLLPSITEPALFWLDGHYSAGVTARGEQDSPIRDELRHLEAHPLRLRHVLLIDDARCFTGEGGYPTLDALRGWARTAGFSRFEVEDDVIRIHHPAAWG